MRCSPLTALARSHLAASGSRQARLCHGSGSGRGGGNGPASSAPRARRRGILRAVRDEFEAWLTANPLPGSPGQDAPGAAAAAAATQPGPRRRADAAPTRRSGVALADVLPRMEELAARGGGGGLLWLPDPHAWVAADAAGRPAAELRLPRVVPAPLPAGPPSLAQHICDLRSGAAAEARGAGRGADADAPGGWPVEAPSPGGPMSQGAAAWAGDLQSSGGDDDDDGDGSGDDDSGFEGGSGDDQDGGLAPHDRVALRASAVEAAATRAAGAPRTGSVLVVLLAADAAALGLWRDGALARHKVLRGYTVRKARGGAQAAFEARGGGRPTEGSALRRREVARLWQAAAGRLGAWAADVEGCHALFRGGAVRNWSLLYGATRPPPPVDRRDPRWRRVGVGVPKPRFESLLAAHAALCRGEWREYD